MNTQLRGVPSYARRERADGQVNDSSAGSRTGSIPSLRVVAKEYSKARQALDWLPVASDPTGRAIIYVPGGQLRGLDRLTALELLLRIRSRIGMQGGALIGIDLLQRVANVGNSPAGFSGSILIRLNKEFDCVFSEGASDPGVQLGGFGKQTLPFLRQVADISTGTQGRSDVLSHRHSLVSLGILARRAHLEIADCWTDFDEQYELALLTPVRCPKASPRPTPCASLPGGRAPDPTDPLTDDIGRAESPQKDIRE